MLSALLEELQLLSEWGAVCGGVIITAERCLVHYISPAGKPMELLIVGETKPLRWHQHATDKITRTSFRTLRKTRYSLRRQNGEFTLLSLRG